MKKLVVIGTGYVGLVTGVCLAKVGHHVTCVDIDKRKVLQLQQGNSPIYEPGLKSSLQELLQQETLTFTTNLSQSIAQAEAIFIAVGTPQRPDGTVDLSFIQKVASDIGDALDHDVTIIVKSTVPVGTNEIVKQWVTLKQPPHRQIDMVSNPEFLREGSAIHDMLFADRIVVGADQSRAARLLEDIYRPFDCPIVHTDIRSAELIKYSSNAFLATKISFINEISTICEKLGANIEDVARGMGMDQRIGGSFLNAGIGYGGSCFPKDTEALVQLAQDVNHHFDLLKSVIKVNNSQQASLVQKALKRFGHLNGKRIAILGLSFKPNTDDIREAASLIVINQLIESGVEVIAYDPVAMDRMKQQLPEISYANTVQEALKDADAAMIVTEWEEFKDLPLGCYKKWMKHPVVFDGRNCYSLDRVRKSGIEYHSIGRAPIFTRKYSLVRTNGHLN